MKVTIKTKNLNLSIEEFRRVCRNLEILVNSEPNEKIKESAKKMNLTINEKEIIVLENSGKLYRVNFYNLNKENNQKAYLGSRNYSSKGQL